MRVATTLWSRFRSLRLGWQVLAWLVLPPLPVALWAASQPRSGRGLAWGLVVLVFAAWVVGLAWAGRPETEASGAGAPETTGVAMVDRLVVAPELPDAGYDRGLFVHWVDADRDGCDTRCEVLAAERRTDLPGLPGGGWLSSYDGQTTGDPSVLDIDHVVALAEAWRSGASGWDPGRMEAFANDLDDAGALVAVSEASNRSKGDSDPATWRPSDPGDWCAFATGWTATKVRWGLTADPDEVAALRSLLATCG